MKKLSTFLLAIVLTASAINLSSCRSKKKDKTPVPKGETEIMVPCSGTEFFSDKKHFRANALGESMDQATSKRRALSNARADLASFVSTTVKAVTDNYVNSREFNNKEQVEERYESLAREVVDQTIQGTRVICERLMKDDATGRFKTYIAVELGSDELVSKINERITKDEIMRIDYDYEQFKKTFEEEMNKRFK